MYLNLIKYYFSLSKWSRCSTEKVKAMQFQKFVDLYKHACKNSLFYQKFYAKHNALNLDLKTWDDISKIPLLSKEMLRNADAKEITTCPLEDVNTHTTSGSSGEPTKIYVDKATDYTAHVRVFYILRKATKYNPFKKILMITRFERDDNFQVEKDLSLLGRLQKKLGLFRREIISIYDDPDYMIERIESSNPHILWSTPSVLDIVANRLSETKKKLSVPYVVTTSEPVTPVIYDKIHSCLCQNSVDIYGAEESPSLGYEVNKSGKKWIFPNTNLFEFINQQESSNGLTGDIVITNLINKTMPIIRYDIRDGGKVDKNEGFAHTYISEISGRIDDILYFPDGKQFVHHHAHEMFMDFDECQQFKFSQKEHSPIRLELKIAPKADKETVYKKAMERWNKRFSGYELEIIFVPQFEINRKTGKFKNIELCP